MATRGTKRHLSGAEEDQPNAKRIHVCSRDDKMHILRLAYDKINRLCPDGLGQLSLRILLNVRTAEKLRGQLCEELYEVALTDPKDLRESWEKYYSKEDSFFVDRVYFSETSNEAHVCTTVEFLEEFTVVSEEEEETEEADEFVCDLDAIGRESIDDL